MSHQVIVSRVCSLGDDRGMWGKMGRRDSSSTARVQNINILFVQGELQFEYIDIKPYGDKHATDMKGCIIIKFCSMNRISVSFGQTKESEKKSQDDLNRQKFYQSFM